MQDFGFVIHSSTVDVTTTVETDTARDQLVNIVAR